METKDRTDRKVVVDASRTIVGRTIPLETQSTAEKPELTVEEIEQMSIDDLKSLSDDSSIPVPEGLSEKIENSILASEILSDTSVMDNSQSKIIQDHSSDSQIYQVAPREKGRAMKENWKKESWNGVNWKRIVWVPAVAASIAAVAVSVRAYSLSRPPKDSFSTPEEAYAQVEQAFAMIGDKTGKALYLTDAALPEMDKASKIIESMNR